MREISLTGMNIAARRSFSAASAEPVVLTEPRRTTVFQTLGVTWRRAGARPDLVISVRTRGAGKWSAWTGLDDDAGDDPVAPAAGTRGGTDPLWVGPSDGVQVRVSVRSGRLPADLRLTLVDPGTSAADAAGAGSGGPAVASAGRPAIRTRAQWGANEDRVACAPDYMSTIRGAVLHHTAGPNSYSRGQVPGILRGDYAYHLSRGWCDIGYNALVDRFGRIWEGRAGGLERAVTGAHAGGFNTDTFGVAVIGNYDRARPGPAVIDAVARVVAWKLDLYHRNPTGTTKLTSAGGGTARYRAGRTVRLPVVMGHRNTGFTACPGRYLYPYLGSIRSKVKARMKAALLDPAGPPASVPAGRAVSISARALARQTWRLDVTAPFGGGRVARVSGSAKAGQKFRATWDGRVTGGARARPGRYRLTLTSRSAQGTARPVTDDVLVLPPAPGAETPGVPSGGAGGYVPVPPTRVFDTTTGGRVGLGPAGRADIPVLGVAGVPATGVASVVLNLTASRASDDTTLSVWPTGRPTKRPLTGVPAGLTRSALAVTRVGAAGTVSVGNSRGVTELAVDVVGWFAATDAGARVVPVPSTRIYQSGTDPAGKVTGPRVVNLPPTVGGIPSEQVTGVVVDLSALAPAGAGTLAAYRPGATGGRPALNYRRGESIDNLAFVEVSGGAVVVAATGTPVHVILDVRAVMVAPGSTAGTVYHPVQPALALDTGAKAALKKGATLIVPVTGRGTGVPLTASAVLVDLAAVAPPERTWLQGFASGGPSPGGTAVRVPVGQTRGNLAIVPVGPGGTIAVQNARGAARVRVDVLGYFEEPSPEGS